MQSRAENYTVIIIGDTSTGKTAILERFLKNPDATNNSPTIGANIASSSIQIGDTAMQLTIYDTAGQNQYRSTLPYYYHQAHGILLVFDLSNIESFTNLDEWKNDIENNAGADVPIVLVGNKSDLEPTITKEDINNYLEKYKDTNHKISYIETSALRGINITDAFHQIAEAMLSTNQEIINNQTHSVNLNTHEEPKSCC